LFYAAHITKATRTYSITINITKPQTACINRHRYSFVSGQKRSAVHLDTIGATDLAEE
jgi:hypothetical protein